MTIERFRMRDITSEQRARAFEIAKLEVGVQMVPNDQLTPMALFLMGALADQCIGIAIRESQPPRTISDLRAEVEATNSEIEVEGLT